MTQYLILHKVRGEPAFDIAEKCMIGDEEGWVCSTSGHRAYPWQSWSLKDLADRYDNICGLFEKPMPDDWPDHFPPKEEPKPIDPSIISNLLHSVVKIKRRM